MKRLIVTLAGMAFLLMAPNLEAQRFTGDLRISAAMPTQHLADADLGTGYGFGATIAYRALQHLHLYGGWDWLGFNAEQSFAGSDMDFEETGYTFGLRFEHPIALRSALAYRLEGAATYKHVEVEDNGGDIIADTGHELGFELGVGALLPLGSSWNLAPTLRYRSIAHDFRIGSATTPANLRYTGLEIGVSRKF